MEFKFNFETEEEKELIEKENKDKYFIMEERLFSGNYITISVIKPEKGEPTWEEEIQEKISILEAENQALREELTQIQTSIASLTSLIATTLEEK